jgi:Cdc6-like AAA superfamily ATPase
MLNTSLISYELQNEVYDYFKRFGKEKILNDISKSMFSIFTALKKITNENIIIVIDEFDTIFDIKSEDRDTFLSILRSLKNQRENHKIIVFIFD